MEVPGYLHLVAGERARHVTQRDRSEDDLVGVMAAEHLGRCWIVIAGEPDDVGAAREPGKLGNVRRIDALMRLIVVK